MQQIETPNARIIIKVEVTPDWTKTTTNSDTLAAMREVEALLTSVADTYESMIRRDMIDKIEFILSVTK